MLIDKVDYPNMIYYHYTSLNSAFEILRSKKLRFTHVGYLNDPMELHYGLYLLEEVYTNVYDAHNENKLLLKNLAVIYSLIHIICNSTNRISKKISQLYQIHMEDGIIKAIWNDTFDTGLILQELSYYDLYISCFSTDNDNLSMWRSYSDNAMGLALGFNELTTSSFNTAQLGNGNTSSITKVYYDAMQIKNAYLKIIDEVIKIVLDLQNIEFINEADAKDKSNTILQKGLSLLSIIIICKHPCYAYENEYRIYFFADSNSAKTEIRVRNNQIIPYIDVPFESSIDNNWINNIRIAPASNLRSSDIGLDRFLVSNRYQDLPISKSYLPYQNS